MEEYFGTKELYSVVLKSTYNVGDKIEEGEIIASFDNIQIGGLDQIKTFSNARGGYGNSSLVTWESTKEMVFNFSQGVFSKDQLMLLTNTKLLNKTNENIEIFKQETLEVEEHKITLSHTPSGKVYLYYWLNNVYQKDIKLNVSSTEISLPLIPNGTEILVRYDYIYIGNYEIAQLGSNLTNGFLSLEGHMRLKDDQTGNNVTGIIKIPKLKLMSGLSMRLGRNANPFVADFKGTGYPVGFRGDQMVCQLFILPSDIDSDI